MTSSAINPSSPLTGTDPAFSRRRSQDPTARGLASPAYLAKISEEDEVGLGNSNRSMGLHGGVPPSPSTALGLFDQEYSPVTTTFPSSRSRRMRTVSSSREQLALIASGTPRRLWFPSLRRWILNPLSVSTGRPYLRSLSTLLIWLLTLWTFANYIPTSSPISNSQSRFGSAMDWLTSWNGDVEYAVMPSSYFPEPPVRPADAYNSPNRLYRPFRPLDSPKAPFPRLRPTRFLPPKCLESWFANGEILCGRQQLGPEEMLDVTWLWVNGSDPRWQKEMIRVRKEKQIYSPEHHFRENNELLYSMRSVLQNLPGRLRTFHLITADTAFDVEQDLSLLPHQAIKELENAAEQEFHLSPSEELRLSDSGMDLSKKGTIKSSFSLRGRAGGVMPDRNAGHTFRQSDPSVSDRTKLWLNTTWRVAQTPSWLSYDMIDLSSPKHPLHHLYTNPTVEKPAEAAHLYFNSHPSLKYAGHSEIFHLPSRLPSGKAVSTAVDEQRKEEEWRQHALPNFNSMAIESRIGFLWGLSDVSLSFNDDFFILKPHAVSDFYSPLYGAVIRFDQGVSLLKSLPPVQGLIVFFSTTNKSSRF